VENPKCRLSTSVAAFKVVRLNPVLPSKTQAITYMGYRGIDRKDPRYYSALVLNQILGGDTLSSRLGTEIRDRLGLTMASTAPSRQAPGPFFCDADCSEDAQRAIASTRTLIQQIHKQGVTADEMRWLSARSPAAIQFLWQTLTN